MIQAILKVPEAEYWRMEETGVASSLPDPAVADIQASMGQITADPLQGTRGVNGYKLVNFVGDTTIARIEAFAATYALDWEILAANDAGTGEQFVRYDPAVLIDYLADVVTYGEDGRETGRTRPLAVGHIGRFSGMPDFEPQPG